MKLIDKDALVAEIENLLDKGRYNEEYDCAYRDGNNNALYALKNKLNTLEVKGVQEEPVSEELEKAHIWKPADGDDLPECDREVIAILDYDFGHYKVVYAHRPNPNGWDGTNIDTGEKEHFEPVIYDKGGWNQPHILYWLDARLPYEKNKITKQE